MDDSRTLEQKREQYIREIALRVPARNCHDKFMIDVYQRLLEDADWFIRFGLSQIAEAQTSTDCLNATPQK